MIDEVQLKILYEQISAYKEATISNLKKNKEILSCIDKILTLIDGYPQETKEKIDEIFERFHIFEEALSNLELKEVPVIHCGFWHYFKIFLLMLGSSCLTLFIYLLFFLA